jgi:gliding motility-associated-like protein
VLCNGASTGEIDVSASGGTLPYTYSWTGNGVVPAAEDQEDLAAGNYSVTVTDNNNCTSQVYAVSIIEPPALNGSITSQTNVSVPGGSDGSVTIAGSGGTAPYQYKLGSGSFQASGTFNSLSAGLYSIEIQDNNLCLFSLQVTITEPVIVLTGSIVSQTNVACRGSLTGSVTVSGTGGTAPYEYKLGTGVYQSSATFGSLAAGDYVITIRDAALSTFDLNVTITQPSASLGGSVSSRTDILCNGDNTGAATISGSGGTSPYQYKIGSGSYQGSGSFSSLEAGTYTVTIEDANLCTNDVAFTISEPSAISVVSTIVHASCPGRPDGRITVTISGGVGPYTILWSDENTATDRQNIVSGTYNSEVTDANGCKEDHTAVVNYINTENCIEIQEIITPNNDGFYDTWKIKNIEMFPNAEVHVFNRWGKRVFSTKNIAANEWDGTSDGKLLPTDSYHFILYLNDGSDPITGTITIIR